MPPGTKHKTNSSRLKNSPLHSSLVKPVFLSRHASRVDQPLIEPPNMSRQPSTRAQNIPYESALEQCKSINLKLKVVGPAQEKHEFDNFACKITESNEVLVWKLVNDLRSRELSYPLEKVVVSILSLEETEQIKNHHVYTPDLPVYVNLGIDPLPQTAVFKLAPEQTELEIKFRSSTSSLLNQILGQQTLVSERNLKKNKQTKQRNLAEVVEKVAIWRRLYTGFYDQNKTFVQMSLDKAAEKVGIQKKTLDDYLLQIRYGKRFAFNFNTYHSEPISKLRQYVKQKKESDKKERTGQNNNKIEE